MGDDLTTEAPRAIERSHPNECTENMSPDITREGALQEADGDHGSTDSEDARRIGAILFAAAAAITSDTSSDAEMSED